MGRVANGEFGMADQEAPQDERQAKTPPYVSYATFKTFITELHEHGVPGRIDRSVLGRFSGITGSQLMTTLRFLRLMDDKGTPTAALTALVQAHGTDGWSASLKPVLVAAYAPVFRLDLGNATPGQFNEVFAKAFPATEAVLQKCKAFFLPAAADAGVAISPRILNGKKTRTAGVQRRRPKAALGVGSAAEKNDGAAAKSKKDELPPDPPRDAGGLLEKMVDKFPTFDPNWPEDVKSKWLDNFKIVFGVVSPGKGP